MDIQQTKNCFEGALVRKLFVILIFCGILLGLSHKWKGLARNPLIFRIFSEHKEYFIISDKISPTSTQKEEMNSK